MSVFTADDGAQYREVGGILRVRDGAWEFADDSTLQPDDLTLDLVQASTLTVSYPAGLKVISFSASPDAHFANLRGATFGADADPAGTAIIRGRFMTGLLYFTSWTDESTAIHVRGRILVQVAEPAE